MPDPLQVYQQQWFGQPLDLMQLGEVVATFDGNDRQTGNLTAFHKRAIGRVERHQQARVTAAGDDLASRTQRISEATTDLQEQTEDIFDALDSGRMEVTDARAPLAKIKNEHRMLHDQIAQLKADEQAAAALAAMPAEEFEQSYLASTPALRRALPAITLEILNQP
jgi:chromosome segregation ATPase